MLFIRARRSEGARARRTRSAVIGRAEPFGVGALRRFGSLVARDGSAIAEPMAASARATANRLAVARCGRSIDLRVRDAHRLPAASGERVSVARGDLAPIGSGTIRIIVRRDAFAGEAIRGEIAKACARRAASTRTAAGARGDS